MAEEDKKIRTDADRIADAILKTLEAIDKVTETDKAVAYARKGKILTGFVHWLLKRPAACLECQEKLDPKLRELCPKHTGIAVSVNFLRDKAKEHAPKIAMWGMSKAQEVIDKYLGNTIDATPDDDFAPPKE